MNLLCSKKTLIETNFIFNIKKMNSNFDHVDKSVKKGDGKFRNLYYYIRKKEGRIYTDEQLMQLPSIASEHIYAKEWQLRKESSDRLIKHLSSFHRNLNILEVGCGNGWLTRRLSDVPGSNVVGIDVNTEELLQARRVFGEIRNLRFVESGPGDSSLPDKFYDVIVFAASIQYFKDLHSTLQWALDHLNKDGSIHILDSHFYQDQEIDAAAERTTNYFSSMGLPAMSSYYFHHSLSSIKKFNYKILFDPKKFINRLMGRNGIFPWIMIQHL
jgi:ubiquinone/menaquinone biosynthesis C-methylase UbiE